MFKLKRKNKPLSHVTDEVIKMYSKRCNHGTDSIEEIYLKLNRINTLGKKVYTYSDDTEHYLIMYFDIVLEVNNCIGVNFYRDKYNEPVRIRYDDYMKYNKKYGLKSKAWYIK